MWRRIWSVQNCIRKRHSRNMRITRAAASNHYYWLNKGEVVTCNFSLQLHTHTQMKVHPKQKKTQVMPTHERSITHETNVILHARVRNNIIQKCSTDHCTWLTINCHPLKIYTMIREYFNPLNAIDRLLHPKNKNKTRTINYHECTVSLELVEGQDMRRRPLLSPNFGFWLWE